MIDISFTNIGKKTKLQAPNPEFVRMQRYLVGHLSIGLAGFEIREIEIGRTFEQLMPNPDPRQLSSNHHGHSFLKCPH